MINYLNNIYFIINIMASIKLCKNQDCSEEQTDSQSIKCLLCDGYFQDDGLNDLYFLTENGESGSCSLCGKTEEICTMKGTGENLCANGCDHSDEEDDEDD